ncbi:unnamed protein product [Zymoseptoria tritici ST99CH_1A5]|uniref:Protein kinase domain-containing protein n=1 Tax=Zymoseptoria tritici ST99CH_1A5 TaxID=1276529 RepID=A0A1Y6M3K7_ZYMTR|nr:unnamed protein product [Zymoseptoria tritici ST99CH_1A5]
MSDDEQGDIDDSVLHAMDHWEQTFKNISQRYRLINRIGEGTFSTVYEAEDLLYDHRSLPTKLLIGHPSLVLPKKPALEVIAILTFACDCLRDLESLARPHSGNISFTCLRRVLGILQDDASPDFNTDSSHICSTNCQIYRHPQLLQRLP